MVERIVLKFKNDFHSKKPRQSESHKSQPVSQNRHFPDFNNNHSVTFMCISFVDYMFMHIESPVPDPDLEIKGGGRRGVVVNQTLR